MRYYEQMARRWFDALTTNPNAIKVILSLAHAPAPSLRTLAKRAGVPYSTVRVLCGLSKRHKFPLLHLIQLQALDGANNVIVTLSPLGKRVANMLRNHRLSYNSLVTNAIRFLIAPMCAQSVHLHENENPINKAQSTKTAPKLSEGGGYTYNKDVNKRLYLRCATHTSNDKPNSPKEELLFLFKTVSTKCRKPSRKEFSAIAAMYKQMRQKGFTLQEICNAISDAVTFRPHLKDNPLAVVKFAAYLLKHTIPEAKLNDISQAPSNARAKLKELNPFAHLAPADEDNDAQEECQVCHNIVPSKLMTTYTLPRAVSIECDRSVSKALAQYHGVRMCRDCLLRLKKEEARIIARYLK